MNASKSKPRPATDQFSEKQILAAPESDYMSSEQLDFFKHRLLELYALTQARIEEAREQIACLLARPTAEYCAEVKALKEIKEHHFIG